MQAIDSSLFVGGMGQTIHFELFFVQGTWRNRIIKKGCLHIYSRHMLLVAFLPCCRGSKRLILTWMLGSNVGPDRMKHSFTRCSSTFATVLFENETKWLFLQLLFQPKWWCIVTALPRRGGRISRDSSWSKFHFKHMMFGGSKVIDIPMLSSISRSLILIWAEHILSNL